MFLVPGSGLKSSLENWHKDVGNQEEPEGSGSPVYYDLTQGKLGAEVKVEVVITDKLRRAYYLSRTQPSA